MKYLRNDTLTIAKQEKTTAEMVRTIVESAGTENGIGIDDQRKRFRILEAIENGPDHAIVLEDADMETLKSLAQRMKWAIVSRDIIALHDAIEKPLDKDPKEIDRVADLEAYEEEQGTGPGRRR